MSSDSTAAKAVDQKGWTQMQTISKYTFTSQKLFIHIMLFLQQYSLPTLLVILVTDPLTGIGYSKKMGLDFSGL